MQNLRFIGCFSGSAALLLTISVSAVADGPSTYESAGQIDAFIKTCGDRFPAQASNFKKSILMAHSCGQPVADLEHELKEARQHKHPQVIDQYKKGLNEINDMTSQLTNNESKTLCEGFKEIKC